MDGISDSDFVVESDPTIPLKTMILKNVIINIHIKNTKAFSMIALNMENIITPVQIINGA
jgi:hypothetical protein